MTFAATARRTLESTADMTSLASHVRVCTGKREPGFEMIKLRLWRGSAQPWPEQHHDPCKPKPPWQAPRTPARHARSSTIPGGALRRLQGPLDGDERRC